MTSRHRVALDDPDLGYRVELVIDVEAGRLECEELTLRRIQGGEPITGSALRSVPVGLYVRRALQAPGVLLHQTGTSERSTTYSLPDPHALADAVTEQASRRSAEEALPLVAQVYREALASPDPGISRRPTATVAARLHYHRGHAARLVTQARKAGLLGPAHRNRGGESLPPPP